MVNTIGCRAYCIQLLHLDGLLYIKIVNTANVPALRIRQPSPCLSLSFYSLLCASNICVREGAENTQRGGGYAK